ncbi:hypothetical protein ACPV5S_20120 [Vibrio astriarenae]
MNRLDKATLIEELEGKHKRKYDPLKLLGAIASGSPVDEKELGLELEASRALQEFEGYAIPTKLSVQGATVTIVNLGFLLSKVLSLSGNLRNNNTVTAASLVNSDRREWDILPELLSSTVIDLGAQIRVENFDNIVTNIDNVGEPTWHDWDDLDFTDEVQDSDFSITTEGQTDAKTVALGYSITRKLTKMASRGFLESIAVNATVKLLTTALDKAVVGEGGREPLGLINNPNINDVTIATPGRPTNEELAAFVKMAADNKTLFGSKWLISTDVYNFLSTTPIDQGSGRFVINDATNQIQGFEYQIGEMLPPEGIAFGRWQDLQNVIFDDLQIVTIPRPAGGFRMVLSLGFDSVPLRNKSFTRGVEAND